MFETWGRAIYRRRRLVLVITLAVVVFAGVWGTGVFGSLQSAGGFNTPNSQSQRAADLAASAFGRDSGDVVVLYRSTTRTVADPAYRAAVTGTLGALPRSKVESVATYWSTGSRQFVSASGRETYAVLELTGADDAARIKSFDAIAGRYALHHVDLTVIAPIFDAILVPGGVGGFVETMGLNPLLNLSRRRLAGRAGVASYGSEDERPLTGTDLRVLESEIGPVRLTTGRMEFLRIFDRNVLRHRHPRASTVLGSIDDALSRAGLTRLSYHQVVTVLKQPALAGPAGPDRVAAR